MIDTIRFKVPIYGHYYDLIKSKSLIVIKKDNIYPITEDERLEYTLSVDPYKAKFRILVYDHNIAYLEGSLPKVFYGHNVKLLYPSQLLSAVELLYESLKAYYGDFPPYKTWTVQRLDMCYAYKLSAQPEALTVFEYLTRLSYPKKSFHLYEKETIIFGARTFSVKFYMKQPEFRKFGYKDLVMNGFDKLAHEALDLSEGVLRFEITLRKMKLNTIAKKEGLKVFTVQNLLNDKLYLNTLNESLDVLFKGLKKKSMPYDRIVSKLLKNFNKDKPLKLFNFNTNYFSPDPAIRQAVKKLCNKSTIKRYFDDLKFAGIGFGVSDESINFDLSIPNKNVVNKDMLLDPL